MSNTCCGGASPAGKKRSKSCCGGTAEVAGAAEKQCCQKPAEENHEDTAEDCCCGEASQALVQEKYVTGYVDTPAGRVPRVSTTLAFRDVWGSWKARWSLGRMNYTVEPGLYCLGNPGAESPVLVTANYKMTFDRLRIELTGVDAFILVLDTRGINVWCAAGKGTFGTEELVDKIKSVNLSAIVSHRTVILPQFGATGVAAHEITRQTKFHVVYGPVRASDIRAFLAAGMQATAEMRTVKFTFFDRLVLTPMEVVGSIKPAIIVFGILFILNAIGFGHYGLEDLIAFAGTVVAGCVLAPLLMPWIPGRAFAFKGFLLGLLWAVGLNVLYGFPAMPGYGWLKAAAYMLILPSLASFAMMNFTGSSTYTSLSGVDKEMKIALPLQMIATALGIILLLVNDFILVFS